jgi:hypothetical protein
MPAARPDSVLYIGRCGGGQARGEVVNQEVVIVAVGQKTHNVPRIGDEEIQL